MFHSNFLEAANASDFGRPSRHRSTPVVESLTPVPGFPRKLVVYKIPASRFWQVRCWVNGRFVKRSTRSESMAVAKHYARRFFAEVMVESVLTAPRVATTQPQALAGPAGTLLTLRHSCV